MKNSGFTLLEILVSALIMAIVMLGLANVFFAGKRYVIHSRSRIAATEIGKTFLDPLATQVRQVANNTTATDGWDEANNSLRVGLRYCDGNGSHAQQENCLSQAERTFDNMVYNATYNITNVSGTDLRKVRLVVNWSEWNGTD
jgi:prepilin-type N-terminal cleavage/methylation domain-containing protein